MRLKYSRGTVDVDYEARQTVSLAMNEAIYRSIGTAGQSYGPAHTVGLGEAAEPESAVERFVAEREDAHGDGTHLPVTHSQEIAVLVEHTHRVALLKAGITPSNGARENPRVKPLQALGLAATQHDSLMQLTISG